MFVAIARMFLVTTEKGVRYAAPKARVGAIISKKESRKCADPLESEEVVVKRRGRALRRRTRQAALDKPRVHDWQ